MGRSFHEKGEEALPVRGKRINRGRGTTDALSFLPGEQNVTHQEGSEGVE